MTDRERYNCLLELVKARRTVRQFKSDPVADADITRILEVARWAPSGFHTQPWEFIVVKDKNVRGKIISVLEQKAPPIKGTIQDHAGQPPSRGDYRDAPVFIILLCDWRARVGLPDSRKNDDAQVAQVFDSSLASAFLYMHLAATSLGLASQWYSATSGQETERAIKEIIGIPEALKIYDMMVLGYPAQRPIPKVVRGLNDIIHYDNCGVDDFRTDEEVSADARKTKAWCMAAH